MKSFYNAEKIEAGCDEAGRGCLAGPVVAASVILPKNFNHPFLNDSKQLSEKMRDECFSVIKNEAIAWGIGSASHIEIDKINILNASFLSMHRAIAAMKIEPQFLLIDGNRFKTYQCIPHQCIVKGDSKYYSIAAASILAKVYRDALMTDLHHKFPHYGWNRNKGYPTLAHRDAIRQYGETSHHRKSFQLLPIQQETIF